MRYRDLTGIDYDCDDCIHNDKEWYELPCDTCCHAHSGYEPREQECAECGARTKLFPKGLILGEDAIEAWNRRIANE